MRRILSLMTGAAIALSIGLSSCADDDPENDIHLTDETSAECLLDCEDAVGKISFTADGKWSATVEYESENDLKWVYLPKKSGVGSGSLEYQVSSNVSTSGRTATVVISSDGHSVRYTIHQSPELSEENTVDASMFGKSKPLGYGLKMEKDDDGTDNSKLIKKQLFKVNSVKNNLNSHREAMTKFGVGTGDYIYLDIPNSLDAKLLDDEAAESETRDISASLKVSVAYGIFKLKLDGAFKMFGQSTNSILSHGVIAEKPVGNFEITDEFLSDYRKLENAYSKAKTKEEKDLISTLMGYYLNNDFVEIRDSIESYVKSGQTFNGANNAKLLEALDNLDYHFGPVYISSIDVGGNASLNYSLAYQAGTDTLDIKGKLNIALNAMLNFDVEAEAKYRNFMTQNTYSQNASVRISGGTPAAQNNLLMGFTNLLLNDNKQSDKQSTVFSSMVTYLNDWYGSLNVNDPSTYTCISYHPTAIWTLFSREAQKEIKAYFKARYPHNADGTNPYLYDIYKMASH